jgi:hypothetical protein
VSFQGLAEIFPNWNFRNQICHLAILIWTNTSKANASKDYQQQSDQIGRILAYWGNVSFGHITYKSGPNFWAIVDYSTYV